MSQKLFYKSIDSTQSEAKRLLKTCPELFFRNDIALVAASQTAGQGTRGRTWFSPADQGIYMTLVRRLDSNILKSGHDLSPWLNQTTIAVAELIIQSLNVYHLTKQELVIKPINDIFYADSKLAGILLETINNYDKSFLLIGLGLNYHKIQLPSGFAANEKTYSIISLQEILPEMAMKLCSKEALIDLIISELCKKEF